MIASGWSITHANVGSQSVHSLSKKMASCRRVPCPCPTVCARLTRTDPVCTAWIFTTPSPAFTTETGTDPPRAFGDAETTRCSGDPWSGLLSRGLEDQPRDFVGMGYQ